MASTSLQIYEVAVMAERGRPLPVWSSMGEVTDIVILYLGLHRARWVRSLGAAHMRGGEGCGVAYLRRSSSPPLLCHARATPPLLYHTRATSPLLIVVLRRPPSLASRLLTTENALCQLRVPHREDARANARAANVIPRSEIAGTKPPYVCSGCFIHTYSNNMINRFHVQ
jgi:hypothetical protein